MLIAKRLLRRARLRLGTRRSKCLPVLFLCSPGCYSYLTRARARTRVGRIIVFCDPLAYEQVLLAWKRDIRAHDASVGARVYARTASEAYAGERVTMSLPYIGYTVRAAAPTRTSLKVPRTTLWLVGPRRRVHSSQRSKTLARSTNSWPPRSGRVRHDLP